MHRAMRIVDRFPRESLQRDSLPAIFAIVMNFALLSGCRAGPLFGEATPKLELTSSSFQDSIPKAFTCDGDDSSPALAWDAPPAATQSLALTVVDIDAPRGSFVHWVLFNLPAQTRELRQGFPTQDQLPDGSRQGKTDFDKISYGGPCPPSGTHRYVFSIYALDTKPNLPAGVTRERLEKAIAGHVLAHGELTGRYHR
jgi:Raf kinase inhibitor-like YbhB/YbcL family protein